jgi:tetratricopeptide (TPR) repeat protein
MDGAEAYYRKCVQLAPSSDRYRVHLAEFLLDRRNRPEKLREAVQLLEETVKLGSEDAAAFFRLGIAYRHSGRTQEAIWSLRHAIDLEPGDGRSYQPLGEVLLAAGRRQEGQEALALFKRYREFDQALETLRVRVKRNPRDLESLRRLAALYERSGALHDAVSACSQILTVTPTDARARRRLEALRQRLGEEEESGSSRPADGGQGAARG